MELMVENELMLVFVVICKYWNLIEKVIIFNSYNRYESDKIICVLFIYLM